MSSLLFTTKIALRYVSANRKTNKIKNLRILTLFFILATLAIFGLDMWWMSINKDMTVKQANLHQFLVLGKYIGVLCIGLFGIFVELICRFTIFTTISTFGMFLGTGALVTVISFMSALRDDLKHKMLETHAHMMVEPKDEPYLSHHQELIEKVKQVKGVLGATPNLVTEMLVVNEQYRDLKAGILVRGVDPITITEITDIEKKMIAGSIHHLLPSSFKEGSSKLPGIVIGKDLAQQLNIFDKKEIPLGTELLLISPIGEIGPGGNMPSVHRFQVVGIFYTGMYEYDARYAYVRLPKLQKMMGLGNEVSGIELKLEDLEASERWIDPVTKALGTGPLGMEYRVEDWKIRNRSLFSSLKLEKIVMFLGLGLIILVAASSVISNGLMLVTEKTPEIAILKSMGATHGEVLQMFTWLGLAVGILGIALGVSAGIVTCKLLSIYGLPISDDIYYVTQMPIPVRIKEVSVICGACLFVIWLATIYPAWSAAKLKPVDGLR